MGGSALAKLLGFWLNIVTSLISRHAMEEVGPVVMPGDVVVSTTLDGGVVKTVAPVVLDCKGPSRGHADPFTILIFVLAGTAIHRVDHLLTIHDIDTVFSNADLDPRIL